MAPTVWPIHVQVLLPAELCCICGKSPPGAAHRISCNPQSHQGQDGSKHLGLGREQEMHLQAHDDVTDVIYCDFSSKHSVESAKCRQSAVQYPTLPFEAALPPICGCCTPFGGGDPLIAQPGGEGCSNGLRASRGLRPPNLILAPVIVKLSGNVYDDCMPFVEPLTKSLSVGRRAAVRPPFLASP